MFEARYPGICSACGQSFPAGAQVKLNGTVQRADKVVKGYAHAVCVSRQRPGSRPSAWTAVREAAEQQALEQAVTAREVAEDDYYEAEYVQAQLGRPLRVVGIFLQAMIDARMAAMLEADAVGIINLFDPVTGGEEEAWLRTADIVAFGGNHAAADAAMGNAYGAAEAEQERAAYQREMDAEDARWFGTP